MRDRTLIGFVGYSFAPIGAALGVASSPALCYRAEHLCEDPAAAPQHSGERDAGAISFDID